MDLNRYNKLLDAWRKTVEDTIKREGVETTCLWLGYGILREFERIKNGVDELLGFIEGELLDIPEMVRFAEFYIQHLKNKYVSPLLEDLYRTRALLAVSDEFCKSCFSISHMKYIDRMIEILETYNPTALIKNKLLRDELREYATTLHNSAPSVFLCKSK